METKRKTKITKTVGLSDKSARRQSAIKNSRGTSRRRPKGNVAESRSAGTEVQRDTNTTKRDLPDKELSKTDRTNVDNKQGRRTVIKVKQSHIQPTSKSKQLDSVQILEDKEIKKLENDDIVSISKAEIDYEGPSQEITGREEVLDVDNGTDGGDDIKNDEMKEEVSNQNDETTPTFQSMFTSFLKVADSTAFSVGKFIRKTTCYDPN